MRAEAPPCGGSQNSPRWLRHENNTAPTEAELANLQRTLFLNKANAACGGELGDSRSGEPPRREAAARAILRIAKPPKTGAKQPQTNNDFLLILPRLYAASGLLNLRTTLTRAVTLVTPGQLFSDAKIADSAAGCRYRYIFCTVATMYPGLSAHTSELRNRRSHAIRGRSIPAENRHLTATNDQKKHVATPAGGLTEKAIRHRRTKINHYLRAAYTPIKPSCSNTIS